MKRAVCTISTKSYLPKVYALFESVSKFDPNSSLEVLVVDVTAKELSNLNSPIEEVTFRPLSEIKFNYAQEAIAKYQKYPDKLRWTFKPIFLNYLLNEGNYEKAIYVDNDIYFTGSFDFLWEELDTHHILLTPHFRPSDPTKEPLWFETNFRDGIYNAGFIGAAKGSESALDWWTNVCIYKCTKSYIQGMFDDQKYLDMMPVIEPKTKVIHNMGCNVAYWNIKEAKRKITNGKVIIEDKYPLVFVHYADCTIAAIMRDEDPMLKEPLKEYLAVLEKYGFKVDTQKVLKNEGFWVKYRNAKWQLLWSYLNWFK